MGDIVVVSAGEIIPVDGVIVAGIASVDQHILTGEAQPVEMEAEDHVFASTIVLAGSIDIQVEKAGEETTAAKIAEILSATADSKLSIQSRGEAWADQSALPTMFLGSLALLTVSPAAALTTLNACFAFYMRVLAPISMLNTLNLASQNLILVKDGRVLDLLPKIDTVVFDKTGTLTEEQPHVGRIHTYSDYNENEVLAYAAAAEHKQTHPTARAILEEANEQQLSLSQIDDAEYKIGYGLTVFMNSKVVRVGSIRFMDLEEITVPIALKETQSFCHDQGHSLVMVAVNDILIGAIELLPTVRKEAKVIISQLYQHGIKSIYIISGDHEKPTQKLAQKLGIEHYFAETLPENKAELIAGLQQQGKSICYIGDGINDSIALQQADVSISLRGASTVATDTAQIILMDQSLSQLSKLFQIAKDLDINMKTTLMATLIPGIVTVSGAFFLNFHLIHSIVLNQIGFGVGLSNTMRPILKYRKEKPKSNSATNLMDASIPSASKYNIGGTKFGDGHRCVQ